MDNLTLHDIEERTLKEKDHLEIFIQKAGLQNVRRPQDASQGVMFANGIASFHVVFAIINIWFYYYKGDQDGGTAKHESRANSAECKALKTKKDYMSDGKWRDI
jgi:hypothetical protein